TLYAAFRELNTPERKLMSAEDPVEYTFPGTVQASVNPREGVTFPALLRAFLRNDPDVIMVAEVRDAETAQICAQTALTGHIVLGSLHPEDTADTLLRLGDLGLDAYSVTNAVRLVVAQRLVRVLCRRCATPAAPEGPAQEQLSAAAGAAREGGVNWDALPLAF